LKLIVVKSEQILHRILQNATVSPDSIQAPSRVLSAQTDTKDLSINKHAKQFHNALHLSNTLVFGTQLHVVNAENVIRVKGWTVKTDRSAAIKTL